MVPEPFIMHHPDDVAQPATLFSLEAVPSLCVLTLYRQPSYQLPSHGVSASHLGDNANGLFLVVRSILSGCGETVMVSDPLLATTLWAVVNGG